MSAVVIDSNVLLDVLTRDSQWSAWSTEAIERAANRYRLVINPVIYGEISIHFSRIEELNAALPRSLFDREAIPYDAAFLAGRAFLTYRGGAAPGDLLFRTFSLVLMRLSPGTNYLRATLRDIGRTFPR